MKGKGKKRVTNEKVVTTLALILGMFIGAFAVVIYLKYMEEVFKGEGIALEVIKLGMLFLNILICFFLQIVLHEAGHLIFGLFSGYTFISFRIGSATLVRDEGKWQIKKFNIPGTGGQCLMMPPEMKGDNFPFIAYNLGGVIMNLILGIVPILMVTFIEGMGSWLKGFLLIFGVVGIVSALLNGIPLKAGGVANDGSNLLDLLKDVEARRAFYLQLKFNGLLSMGKRPRDMEISDFQLSEGADVVSPLNTAMILMQYNYYLDNMNFQKGRELLNSLNPYLNKILGLYRYEIDCEKIFLELVLEEDKGLVEKLYDKELCKYIKACKGMISKKRVMMAYELLYNKDEKRAEELHEAGKALAKTYPIKGEIAMEIMLMDYVESLKSVYHKENEI